MIIRALRTAALVAGIGLLCGSIAWAHQPNRHTVHTEYGSDIVSGNIANGGRYVLLPGGAVPLTAVELWYAVPSTGYGTAPMRSIARLTAQTVAASAPAGGSSLGDFVASVGGTLSIDVFSNSVAITVLVPSSDTAAAIRVMTHNYFSPVVTDAGLRRAKLDLATQAVLDKFDADTVIRDGLMSALFTDGPAHFPTLDVRDLNTLDIASVRGFAEEGFQTRRASLIVTGASATTLVAASHVGSSLTARNVIEAPASTIAPKPANLAVKFSQPGDGFAWVGPDIADEQAATAMDFIADYLFHPVDGTVTRLLASAAPDVTLNGQFITLRKPGVFLVSVFGNGAHVAAIAVRKQIAELSTPLPSAAFEQARNAFIYHLQSNLQSPADLAASIGWYATEGRPGYAPGAAGDGGAYFHDASSLTPDAVAAVARQFLATQPVTLTLQPAAEERSH